MINLILFKKQSEFFNYCKNLSPVEEQIIVTPSPVLADLARRKFSNIPTVTIQKFLQDQFDFLMSEEELESLKELKLKKSKLLQYLGFLWKQVFPENDIILFRKAYKFLTDLRSFTLSHDVFENALEDEEKSLKEAVLIFQKFMTDKDIFDEHRGYYELAERLRSGKLPIEYPLNKKIIFWGFDFFSPLQVDLLKALGIRDEIYLGVYKTVFDKAYSVDWVKWIENDKLNLISLNADPSSKVSVKARKFPKNGLAQELKSLVNEHSSLKHNFFLATRDFSFDKIQEIPETNVLFRTQVNLLETSLKKLKDNLRDVLSMRELTQDELLTFVEEEKTKGIEEQNFLFLKTIFLFEATLKSWFELNADHKIGLFDLELLMDVVELDSPRNNLFPLVKEEEKGEILPIKMLTDIKEEELNIICASKNYGSLIGNESYSDSLEKKLTAIGPIRRAGFLFETLKAQIIEALELKNSILIFENGIEEQDIAWSQIFSEIDVELESSREKKIERSGKVNFKRLDKPVELKTLSATKIQTFLDCPRKFFMRYIGQDEPNIKLEDEIGFNVIGTIEHEVIELYLKENNIYHDDIHISLVKAVIDRTLSENKIKLDANEYQAVLIEVRDYTKDAISFLLNLSKTINLKFTIEKRIDGKVSGVKRVGSIDCVGEGSGIMALLDFKRSSSSIPSLADIKNFKKVQALFYRQAMIEDKKLDESDIVLWGYINLSQIEESLLICNDEDTIKTLTSELHKIKINSEQKHFEEIDSNYKTFEEEVIKKMEVETLFSPMPSAPQVCLYCELKTICPKKEEL